MPFVIVGLVSGSVYGMAGVGLVLSYKTSGIFNFAHGSVAAAMAYAFYELHVVHRAPWPLALAVTTLMLGPAIGLLLEMMARRLSGAPVVNKVAATLGLVIALQQLAFIRYGTATRQFPAFLPRRAFGIAGAKVGIDQAIVMAVALAAVIGLSVLFRSARLGLAMRGVVDDPELLALAGTNPTAVRRWAWCIGSAFAALSGILLAPTIGLDVSILTLLVVQAFGAAAVGSFTSLSLTYVGGLAIGVGAALSSKYVADISWLAGFGPSLPFIVLFTALVVVPRRRLIDIAPQRRPFVPVSRRLRPATLRVGATAGVVGLALVPQVVGFRIGVYTNGLISLIVFLSLALLVRTSGQLSLAHLGFAAIGGATFLHLTHSGVPWLLAVVSGGVLAVPVGAIVAIPAIRLSGLYLALATFGFGLLVERLLFPTTLMFGGPAQLYRAARPSFGASDNGYYYVVLAFALASVALVVTVRRSRLGRLLRAMADSPLGLSTYGTNVTVVKVLVFCVSAFLAGIAGALVGPLSGSVGGIQFGTFQSLALVVVLVLQGRVGEVRAAFGAVLLVNILPAYARGAANEYSNVVFGLGVVAAAIVGARQGKADWLERAVGPAKERLAHSPSRARLADLARHDAAGAMP